MLEPKTEFDEFAHNYGSLHELPYSKYFIEYTFRKFLPKESVSGKSVLDLGCGEGYYSRLVKSMGATRVVGIDVSSSMIAHARRREEEDPHGIEYFQEEIVKLHRNDRFDVVLFVLVLDLVESREELRDMCEVAYKHLSPGGRVIVLTNVLPPTPEIREYEFRKYGIIISVTGASKSGDMYGDLRFHYAENAKWNAPAARLLLFSKETYVKYMRQAGFDKVEWKPFSVSPDCPSQYDAKYWKNILDSQLFGGMVCVKN